MSIQFKPGQSIVNTKQRRVQTNYDKPEFYISHAMGFDGVLGSNFPYNMTEASIYNRFWLNSWGYISCKLTGGIQWNKVPYMLLIMPPSNTSFIAQDFNFNLLKSMEFLNDRYAKLDVSWNLNGKIFNRIPLLKKLKWREYIGFSCLWGTVSDKNKPTITMVEDPANPGMMIEKSSWPEGVRMMDPKKPYMEFVVGIHNILKIFHIQYVRRLSYTGYEGVQKNGVRFRVEISF